MVNKETAYKRISELVERFSDQYESYKQADYNETQTRRDFIDPFFKALGWDVDNSEGYAESYREVIHEDKIKVSGATNAPDYAFRLVGGKKLFFVEAKRPSVAVKDEILPAYQIRRYGWSAKLPISIITNFEEFAVYDCTKKPHPSDKASVARIKYLTFKDYLKEFDFIWETFSKEKVLKGGLDKFVKSDTYKKGTATVDKEFLESLDSWRKYLANSIAINNKQLDEDEINFAVQQTIDRIIFLRIAEDRRVEPYGSLKEAIRHGNYYENLFEQFRKADEKYNSGLFDLNKDKISEQLKIDNKVIKTIITELYYPESPYEFSVLSVEILGSAYEQFLGKVIRITPAHHAKIEEKPEVRKAGGVYYTPQYVVDYIVKNTVGKLIENKTPKEVSKIKIVDPACGSGSFLIGAYQYLLDWHKDYYSGNGKPSKGKKDNPLTPEGNLTTVEKKRILLNNIFGVDIDVNAVEVTKLSLLLKCMEGETEASINHQLKLFHERVLPDLDNNIKSGNSLVDTDFYANELDFGFEKKVKPFNWQKEFSEVFKQGGFDCVIGNPPWVDLKGHPPELTKYYFDKYKTTENRINLYAIFIERGLQLLNSRGKFGFIIPNSILYQSSYEKLRKLIIENFGIEKIIRMPDNTFQGVKAETVIITIGNETKKAECIIYDRKDTITEISLHNAKEVNYLNTKDCLKNEFASIDIFTNDKIKKLLKKIETGKTDLQNLCDFTLGITPYDKYKGHSQKQIKERVFHSTTKKDKTFKPVLEGSDVTRYFVKWGGKEYLSYGDWLGAPREKRFFTEPRILVRQIVSGNPLRIYAGYTEEELYNTQSIFNIVAKENSNINLKYILALLNSDLMNFYHSNKYLDLSKNLFQKILIQNCKKFPIKIIDDKNKHEKILHDEIVKLVDQLLKLNEEIREQKLEMKRKLIQRKIDYCESRINEIVYQLYGLTEEEIKIIEGK
jgi:type I restriction-modification system DNA methylase subunit